MATSEVTNHVQAPCPSCGHCPTCGRRPWTLPYYPMYPNYNPWPGTYIWNDTTKSASGQTVYTGAQTVVS